MFSEKLSSSFCLAALLSLAGAIIINGCHFRTSSAGTEGAILVIADELDRPVIRSEIENRFGKVIHTPQPEQLFNISWTDGEALSDKSSSPLLLMATALDGNGPTADLLRRMLTPEVKSGIDSGEYFIFRRTDPWAVPQLLIILVGRTKRELAENAREWGDSLFAWACRFEQQRVTDQLFRKAEQKTLEAEIRSEFGFYISIQHDYIVSQKNNDLDYIRLIRHYPERWITVAWGSLDHDTLFSPGFIFEHRKALGGSFLDPVMVYDDRWDWQESSIGSVQAIRIRGLWATLDPTGGGPFFSYGLWYPDEKKYYIIDGAVFAPGQSKMPFLWQLDAIARTFRHGNKD